MSSTHLDDRPASSERWNIDGFDFDVATVWGLTVARGRFDRAAGSYDVGPDGARLELMVDARSVATGNGLWDDLLRSSAIAEQPEVRFTSTRVRDSGPGKLHVEGRLEAAGKVVPVEFDAALQRVGHGLQLEATTTVDRQHLGTSGGQLGIMLPATVHLRARLDR
jgi:polyisoprenoid-binding protein YceI